MAATKRKGHSTLVSPKVVSWRETVCVAVVLTTSSQEFGVWVAPYKCRIRQAVFLPEVSGDDTQTVKLHNETDAADLSAALDIDALAAWAAAEIVLSDDETIIDQYDAVSLIHAAGSATTAAGNCVVALDIERLDDN
jgi:hypothetical protein